MTVEFFTDDELAQQLHLETVDATLAARVRNSATAKVQAFVGHPIIEVTDDDVELDGGGQRVLQLPHWPVTEVSSVEVDGVALDGSEYHVSRMGALRRMHRRRHASWGYGVVHVVYSHGYATIPDPIKEVALDLAAAAYTNPELLRAESIAGYSVQYGPTIADYHEQLLAEYR